jgi:hypothetical protein
VAYARICIVVTFGWRCVLYVLRQCKQSQAATGMLTVNECLVSMLVSAAELGFRAQLRHQQLVQKGYMVSWLGS